MSLRSMAKLGPGPTALPEFLQYLNGSGKESCPVHESAAHRGEDLSLIGCLPLTEINLGIVIMVMASMT